MSTIYFSTRSLTKIVFCCLLLKNDTSDCTVMGRLEKSSFGETRESEVSVPNGNSVLACKTPLETRARQHSTRATVARASCIVQLFGVRSFVVIA